ncbi:hypothetical protein DFH11DRAFT_1540794 [Phellopilus nigrolimitatus]|nr:hypothetical protein DFH11DRAFT_1540794 [Phellopilus nigrolimitatus]
MRIKYRGAALVLSVVGALVNCAVAVQVLSLWRVLKWETESEWEGSADGWRVDSIKLVWMLLSAYFTTASVVCVVGAAGVIKRTPSFVRLYRDYSLADVCCCGLLTVLTALASFRPSARATVCEEISGQPELLRSLAEAGLNPENCEQWFEHAVVAFVAIAAILLVIRLQFIITVSNFYKQLLRQRLYGSIELNESDVTLSPMESNDGSGTPRRVFLLPARTVQGLQAGLDASVSAISGSNVLRDGGNGGMLVYAPVPISSLSEAEARELASNEAWVSRAPSGHGRKHSHGHGHSHSHSYSRGHRHGQGHAHPLAQSYVHGRIELPVRSDEGLLPTYSEYTDTATGFKA